MGGRNATRKGRWFLLRELDSCLCRHWHRGAPIPTPLSPLPSLLLCAPPPSTFRVALCLGTDLPRIWSPGRRVWPCWSDCTHVLGRDGILFLKCHFTGPRSCAQAISNVRNQSMGGNSKTRWVRGVGFQPPPMWAPLAMDKSGNPLEPQSLCL